MTDKERTIHSDTDHGNGENEVTTSIKLPDIEYELIRYVTTFPGIRYRELLRKSHLSNGSFIHHMQKLERLGIVYATRTSRITRYYLVAISRRETNILDFLKQSTSQLILLHLTQNGPCSTNDLMKITKRTRSTIFWHVKRLQTSQLLISRFIESPEISQNHNHNRLFHLAIHELINKEFVMRIITKYRNQINF